ncbi:MAG: fibronectin type III domain-containing protein [Thaumarchaeota archaeon]|nr:fibronectin type III domain-containing protein [Nitrososphaerota archaeon]
MAKNLSKNLTFAIFAFVVLLIVGFANDVSALQYGRPNSDISKGLWTDTSGGNGNGIMYDEVNEVTQSNNNYAASRNLGSGTASDTWVAGLSGVNDPLVSNNHQVKYAYKKSANSGSTLRLAVTLLQGSTTIATWTHSNISSGWVLRTQTLTAAQTNTISDYANLRLQFTATCTTCTSTLRSVQVSWVDLEIPNAPTVPGAPTSLSATAVSSSQLNLFWNAPASNGGSTITGYKIERESPIGGGWSTIVTNTGTTSTSYSDTGLDAATQYNYRVFAINAVGIGPASATASSVTNTPSATIPGQVTGLVLTPSQAQIILNWNAPNDGGIPIIGYKIEVESPVGNGWSIQVADTGSTSITYADTGLTPSTQYNYRISAINGIGIGLPSNPVNTMTMTSATVPSSPMSLQGIIADSQISISWVTPQSDGGSTITDYVVEYSMDGGSTWSVYQDDVEVQTSSVVTGLDTSQQYRFRVSAVNSVGTGLPSDQVTLNLTESAESGAISESRNPPKFLGIGVYEIIKTENVTKDERMRFENYFPYSVYSYFIDEKNYSHLGTFEKIGQFFNTEKYSTRAFPITIAEDKTIQIQVEILDEYKSSQIEHLALYFDFVETAEIKPGQTYVTFDSPESLSVGDPDGIFKDVKVAKSLENGLLWVIFDITFAKPADSTNILLETWHESQVPVYAKVTDMWEKFEPSKLIQRQQQIGYFAQVLIPQIHTSPNCKLQNLCFDPPVVSILKGGIIQWVNDDTTFIHVITSGSPEAGPDNRFNGFVRPGESYQNVFSAAGTYPYHCEVHPWSTGIVNVYEKTISKDLQPSSSRENVSGDVIIPEKQKFSIVVKTLESGKIKEIEHGDTVVLKTRNLKAEISGYLNTKNKELPAEITIIRPDGSLTTLRTKPSDDGYYFLPIYLGSKWLQGNYHVIVKYNGDQMGNISFYVTDDAREQGFGAVSPRSMPAP